MVRAISLSELLLICFVLVGAASGPTSPDKAGSFRQGKPPWSAGIAAPGAARSGGITRRVSVDSAGAQAGDESYWPAISTDGQVVAFVSDGANLAAGDSNGAGDVFVHERNSGITSRVSLSSDGEQGDGWSYDPALSASGRFVAFESQATNLVAGDTNGVPDVFVHDRQTGATQRVSVASSGIQGDDWSGSPALSADGRFVAFESRAGNLIDDDNNDAWDVFVHDRETGTTARVSVSSSGAEGNGHSLGRAISAGGRYVAFESVAGNLVTGDSGGWGDVFVHDRQTGTTRRVSVAASGAEANDESQGAAISADGHLVAFHSFASNLVHGDSNGHADVFVYDLRTGMMRRVSVGPGGLQANGASYAPALSADGRFVTFQSGARNLVAKDSGGRIDIFVHDLAAGSTTMVSVSSSGRQANGSSKDSKVSSGGDLVVFHSAGSNLVAGDTNEAGDIFLHQREPESPASLSYLPLLFNK